MADVVHHLPGNANKGIELEIDPVQGGADRSKAGLVSSARAWITDAEYRGTGTAISSSTTRHGDDRERAMSMKHGISLRIAGPALSLMAG